MTAIRVGKNQRAALEIYVFDPVFDEDLPFPGSMDWSANRLTIEDRERASTRLTEAANSADDDGDASLRDALTALSYRVARLTG